MRKITMCLLAAAVAVMSSCGGSGSKSADASGNEAEVVVGNAVDLGLSVKWADHNVGAASPEEHGGYFMWSDIKGDKDVSGLNTSSDSITGKIGKDVAATRWGGKWRMPTAREVEELCSKKCLWTWTTINSVAGYKVTGPNGNSIFLPAAGCKQGETTEKGFGKEGYYRASTCTAKGNSEIMYFKSGVNYKSYFAMNVAMSVRPVQD
ncbi:MAG: hypothetical protein IJT89_08465 [Bacteroidaceae bacterium]|jgi:hypothetical protein|nr:hypothetical protein [Bacteroidaceae bacterium]MBQ4460241.1 hypothetical protein [Bacteroidaceae bacterium]MBQ5351592.1 hypothetical protein [Bacteroidaceae bacterium]MBQ7484068.1 hypothetical protein [Bacteroidaceae bacterium]MBR6367383.1 hypothetical protein [Bacteroidaceae bacterium]